MQKGILVVKKFPQIVTFFESLICPVIFSNVAVLFSFNFKLHPNSGIKTFRSHTGSFLVPSDGYWHTERVATGQSTLYGRLRWESYCIGKFIHRLMHNYIATWTSSNSVLWHLFMFDAKFVNHAIVYWEKVVHWIICGCVINYRYTILVILPALIIGYVWFG